MNAYPSELVVQLRPCVHISGLVPEKKAWHDVLPHPTHVHADLCQAIVAYFTRHAQPQAWYPPTLLNYFRAVFVEYAHKVPPARMRAGLRLADERARKAVSGLPPRSPLSPLYPGGPLFPDGIMSPLWIRKHTEYVPAVHIAFFCMPPHDTATLAMDAALIEVLSTLRASLAQRGIKLMVVLLCDPILFAQGIEPRVAHMRRASGLEARGVVFVLSSGTKQQELASFLTNLVNGAKLVARDYYREHARHVRRNRARYPPPPSVAQPIMHAASEAGLIDARKPPAVLGSVGWHVRTHYKLGAFAELQGDVLDAHNMYMEAYKALVHEYLANAQLVEPRTRRWAEAKVLADTLALKLLKLELYHRQWVLAHKQFRHHLKHMTRLCLLWGMSPATYEFWAWLAKQYVMVADLVAASGIPVSAHGFDVPLLRYQAAMCQMQRAQCAAGAPDSKEAQVDHAALIVRELNLAYEAFFRAKRMRLAHLASVRLALAYKDAQPGTTLQYLVRTLQWYRRDAWRELGAVLAAQALECAERVGDQAKMAALAWELHEVVPAPIRPMQKRALERVPQERVAEPVMLTETPPRTVLVHAVFARGTTRAPAPAPFQLVLCLASDAPMPTMHVASVDIFLAGVSEPLVSLTCQDIPKKRIDVGHVAPHATKRAACSLQLTKNEPLYIVGALAAPPATYTFRSVVCTTERGEGLELRVVPPVCAWLVPGTQLPLPPRRDAHTLRVLPPTLEADMPATMHCGQVARLSLPAAHGVPDVLIVSASEGGILDDGLQPRGSITIPRPSSDKTYWLCAPPRPGTMEVKITTRRDETVPCVFVRRTIEVSAAFAVQADMQWQGLDGVCILHMFYNGTRDIRIAHARIECDGLNAELVGVDGAVWTPRDVCVWSAFVNAVQVKAEYVATLVIEWRCADGPNDPVSTTRLPLPHIPPPPVHDVVVRVSAPAHATMHAPVHADVCICNASDSEPADVVVDVRPTSDLDVGGPQHMSVSMLLPREERRVRLELWAKHSGILSMPLISAYRLGGHGADVPVHTTPNVLNVT